MGPGFLPKAKYNNFWSKKMKFKFLERVLHQQVVVIHSANSLCQEQRPSVHLLRSDVISKGGTRKQAVKAQHELEMSSKIIPVHAIKAYGVVELQPNSFFTSALYEVEWSVSLPGRFTAEKGPPGPI